MPKFEKVEKGLYRRPETGVLYVRKFRRGKGEILRSTGETSVSRARQVADQILSDWMRDEFKGSEYYFEEPALQLLKIYKMKATQTYKNYESHLRLYLLPYFEGKGLNEVGKAWPEYVAHQKSVSNRKLQHDRRHLSRILNFSLQNGYITAIPKLELDAGERTPAIGREYTNEELTALLSKASEKGRLKRTRLKLELQLKTGMRAGEVRFLKWEYINLARGFVTLPAEICKTRYGRTYAVEPDLLQRLIAAQGKAGSPYVFPNRWDKSKPESRQSKGWQTIKAELNIKGKQHWLRHTFVTRAVRGGAAPALVQKAVGMSDTVMKRVYLHVNEEDVRQISQMVSESLQVAK